MKQKLFFPCACGSNAGLLTYEISKKMKDSGLADMESVAKISAEISSTLDNAKISDTVALDGFGVCCAKKALALKGITAKSVVLTDLGVVKGKTPINEEIIGTLIQRIKENL